MLANMVAGFLVGVVVGMTGVGGGALMTPILVLIFGFAPQTAVGTDLIFAAVTKSAGWVVHGFRGTVDWQIFRRLSCGSLPAALLTVSYLYYNHSPVMKEGLIIHMVGIAIVITAIGLLIKPLLHRIGRGRRIGNPELFKRLQGPFTVLDVEIVCVLV